MKSEAHTPPPPVARRGSSAAHPPPLRCAPARIRPDLRTGDTHGHARRSGCVCFRGSGQPAPPACCSRLSPAGFAVCPSRRSHTLAALSAPRTASHKQPPLWAWPDARRTGAGRGGSSQRRALRYGRWAAAWQWLVHGWWWGVGSARDSAGRAPGGAAEPADYHGRPRAPCDPRRALARDSHEAACGGLVASPT